MASVLLSVKEYQRRRDMNVNQWSFVLYDLLYLEIDNLIDSKELLAKQTLRSTKSLPQDDTTSFDQAEEIQQRKLVKKKKKAKFELPNPNLVK